MESTYTLAELAPLLCPDCDEDETYRTSRKIQNWVTAGLISPVASKHAGRGVHRRYDRHELYKARVLLELGHYQVPNAVLSIVANLFDDVNPNRTSSLQRRSAGKGATLKELENLIK